MGLGQLAEWVSRAIKYDVTNTETGEQRSFEIIDRNPLAPQWATASYRNAMAIPGVWRASVLLSDILGGVPWDAYRTYGGRNVETLSAPLLEQPSPPDTRITTFSSMALDLLFHGSGIGVYTARSRQGYPTALVPVSADSVGVRRARSNERQWAAGEILYEINGRVFPATEVLHIKGPCKPGDLRGMGVLEAHLDTLSLSHELNRQARNITDAAVPTGKLKVSNPDATEGDLKAAKEGWLKAQRDRTIAVLNATTDFEPLAWNPSETQLVEARQFSLVEIANIFGLDPSWLGAAQSSRVYSNIEQEAINLVKFSLSGHLIRFEQALSLAFPKGTTVKANLDALLRADTLTRYRAHEIGIRAGFWTDDEARGKENLPPLTPAQREQMRPVEAAPVARDEEDEDSA